LVGSAVAPGRERWRQYRLALERIAEVCMGVKCFPIAPAVEAVSLHEVWGGLL